MTKIMYGSFSLQTSNILDYVKYAQAHKNFYKQTKWHSPHTDGVIRSFIDFLSSNDFSYDKNDSETNQALEDLIYEYGCDKNGVYSEEAKSALKNIYIYQGLNPENAVLQNRQPQADWKETLSAVKNVTSSLKTNLAITAKSFWKKSKYYLAGAAFIGLGILGLKSSNITFNKKETTNKKEIKTTPQQTISTLKTADFSSYQTNLPNGLLALKIKTDTVNKTAITKSVIQKNALQAKKISSISNNSVSVSKKDSLYNNYYDTSLEILLGKSKRDALYAQIQKQIKNGIFKAEQGISFRRIAHSMTMSNVYEGNSIIQKAVYSQQKLTPAEQAAFTGHILEIGAKGEKLQKKIVGQKKSSSAHQNKSSSSRYSKASKKLQYQHVKNLQQLRALHNR